MNKTLLLAACLSAATAFAHANDIKARQQYMKEWGGATKKMAAIIKKSDAQSFPAAEFAALAAQIQQNANAPWQHYPAGSNGRGSDATAAVWEQPQQFQVVTTAPQGSASASSALREGLASSKNASKPISNA